MLLVNYVGKKSSLYFLRIYYSCMLNKMVISEINVLLPYVSIWYFEALQMFGNGWKCLEHFFGQSVWSLRCIDPGIPVLLKMLGRWKQMANCFCYTWQRPQNTCINHGQLDLWFSAATELYLIKMLLLRLWCLHRCFFHYYFVSSGFSTCTDCQWELESRDSSVPLHGPYREKRRGQAGLRAAAWPSFTGTGVCYKL